MKTFRNYALSIVDDFSKNPGKLSEIVSKYTSKENLSSQTRNEIQEIVLGTVRLQSILHEIVNSRLEKDPPLKISLLLELALYELIEMDGIPDYATVNSWVDISKEVNSRLSGLVNAVLKNFIKSRDEIKIQIESGKSKNFPDWIVRRCEFPSEQFQEFSYYLSDRPVTDAIVFGHLTDSLEFLSDSDIGLPDHKIVTNISALLKSEDFQKGNVSIMDRASQLVARYSSDTDSKSILDMCSAPGSKLMYWLKNSPQTDMVLAIDKNEKKINQVIQSAERMGLKSRIQTGIGDSTKVNFDKFDCVLVDAPCSGSGVINRKPDIRTNQSGENLKELQQLQTELLENASKMVKIGGKIVYSTCSFLKLENEVVVEKFMRKHLDFHYEVNKDPLFKKYVHGNGLRTFPAITNMDGACVFILRKIA